MHLAPLFKIMPSQELTLPTEQAMDEQLTIHMTGQPGARYTVSQTGAV